MYITTLGPSRILKEVHSIGMFYALRVFVNIQHQNVGPFSCGGPGDAVPLPPEPWSTSYNETITGSWSNIDPNRIWTSINGEAWTSGLVPDDDASIPTSSGTINVASFGPWEFFDASYSGGGLVGAGTIDTKNGPLMAPDGGTFGRGTSHNFDGLSKPFVSAPVCAVAGAGNPVFVATYSDAWQLIGPLHIDISEIRFKLPPKTGEEEKRILAPYAVAMGNAGNSLWGLFKEEVQ